MAQLRDALTSELIFEGDATEVALMATQIGVDKVLFDGVGVVDDNGVSLFDYEEYIRVHEETKAQLDERAGNAKSPEEEESLADEIDRRKEIDDKVAQAVAGTKRALKKAQAKHEPGHEDDPVEEPTQTEAENIPTEVAEAVPVEFGVDDGGSPKEVKPTQKGK